MGQILKIMMERKSIRSYDGRDVPEEVRAKLMAFASSLENPYGLPVEFRLLDGKELPGLSCPVIVGTELFLGAKCPAGPDANEAFGYSFQQLILYAHSLGLGTVWVGGTMDRAAFERAMELGEGEVMPCMTPIGYPAQKRALRDKMMRKGISADTREPFEALFFDGDFAVPLTRTRAGILTEALEALRWAPSAVNRQPWRLLLADGCIHFYLKRSRGMPGGGSIDIQKIDMGIALAQFALAAEETGLRVRFERNAPDALAPEGMEYIASYRLER